MSAEDEVKNLVEEIRDGKQQKDNLLAITQQAIADNAQKSYEEQQDIGEIIMQYKQADQELMRGTMAVAKYGGDPTNMQLMAADKDLGSSSEEDADPYSKLNPEQIRKLEEAKKRLNRYKVKEKPTAKEEDTV